ncbi:MAG TPA: ABC transporter ATP-binding protein [Patescibacteria group bacterium]
MLKTVGINKKFDKKEVLKDIDLTVEDNTVVGLLGPNGAGKTTLMRILVGFYSANSGKILWKGKEIDPKSIVNKKRIGYLPESNPLYPLMTVGEYLEFTANLKGIAKEKVEGEILRVINECGLKEVAGQKIETLSKGYKQRVGLAAALLGDPKLLILDEPTSGLDPNQIIEIRQLIKKLSKKKMILLSTHILPEAKEICSKLLIINRGKIVLDEQTSKIKNLEKKFVELTV